MIYEKTLLKWDTSFRLKNCSTTTFGALLLRSTLACWPPRLQPPEWRLWSTQQFHNLLSTRPGGFSHAPFQMSHDRLTVLQFHWTVTNFSRRNENLSYLTRRYISPPFFRYLCAREIYGWPARLYSHTHGRWPAKTTGKF